MTLTTSPPISRFKEIFDPDLILGLGLAATLDFTFGYVAIRLYAPLRGRPFAMGGKGIDVFGYDDIIMFGIEIAGILLASGRLRKIFIYALWFSLFLKICWIVERNTDVGFM
jgi:hypothetical protein